MAGHDCRRRAGRTGPRVPDAHRAHPPTGRTRRHPAAAAHRRSGDARRPRGRTPQENGSSMEVKPASKLTETNKARNAWRGCDISDLCLLQRGFDITEATRKAGTIPVYSSSGLSYFHNEARLQPPAVITGRKGILGKVFYVEEPCWPHDTTLWVMDFKGNDPRFVHIFLGQFRLERFDAATSVPTLNRNNLVGIPVKLPP